MILDTSFLIDLMNGDKQAVEKLRELEENGQNQSATAITLFELSSGIHRSDLSERERQRVMEVTGDRVVYSLEAELGKNQVK